MKKIIIVIGLLLATGLAMRAQELYGSGFSIDGFASVVTSDFNNEKLGYGVGVNYFFTDNLGVGVEALTDRLDTDIAAGANLIYRIPIGQSAPYVFAGGGYDWETEQVNISVGVGLEHRFTEHWGIFGDARLLKDIEGTDTPSAAFARLGIRIAF